MPGAKDKGDPPATRDALLAAAAAEFEAKGFAGTDTNRIARAAGFAPQTFYRHFADKTDVFICVYQRWQADERTRIAAAVREAEGDEGRLLAAAAALIAAHRASARFRRSLRLLAVEDDRVRAARAASRRAQLETLAPVLRPASSAGQVAALLTVERLCDAAADAETDDLGVREDDWRTAVAAALAALRR
jgi:AcrR family transcriptional regulator